MTSTTEHTQHALWEMSYLTQNDPAQLWFVCLSVCMFTVVNVILVYASMCECVSVCVDVCPV